MCAMISGMFIGSNDGGPPQAYKENLVSLRKLYASLKSIRLLVFELKIFKDFLPFMAVAANLVM